MKSQKQIRFLIYLLPIVFYSCGLFSKEENLEIKEEFPDVVGMIDSTTYEGKRIAGKVQGVAVRGDTLLVLGNGELYMALPGVALHKVPGVTWTYKLAGGVIKQSNACPGFVRFVGNRDSLYVTNDAGEVWKIREIGGNIRYWQDDIWVQRQENGWVGWIGDVPYQLGGLGHLQPAINVVGLEADGWTSVVELGDTVFFYTSPDTLWKINTVNGEKTFEIINVAGSLGGEIADCNGEICLTDEGKIRQYKDDNHYVRRNGRWLQIHYSPEVKSFKSQDRLISLSNPISSNGATIFVGSLGSYMGLLRNDTIYIRYVKDFHQLWADGSHRFAVWNNLLVFAGPGGVYSFPLTEVSNWD